MLCRRALPHDFGTARSWPRRRHAQRDHSPKWCASATAPASPPTADKPRASPVWQILHDHAAKVPGLSPEAAAAISAFLDCEVFAPRENLTTSSNRTRRLAPTNDSRLDREPGGALPAGVVRFARRSPGAPAARYVPAHRRQAHSVTLRASPSPARKGRFSSWGTKGAALVLPPLLPLNPSRPTPLKIQFPTN